MQHQTKGISILKKGNLCILECLFYISSVVLGPISGGRPTIKDLVLYNLENKGLFRSNSPSPFLADKQVLADQF